MCEVNISCHKTVQVVLIHQPREWEENNEHMTGMMVYRKHMLEKCIFLLTFYPQEAGSVGPTSSHAKNGCAGTSCLDPFLKEDSWFGF